jgi:UDP-2,4-diacetamido-2,4,6-trideoxy-beta-L-altropyranose hydrolase
MVMRADGGSTIGIGHAMRLLALGEAWIEQGGTAVWVVADAPPSVVERATASGIAVDRLAAGPGSSDDAAALLDLLVANPTARAVIDGPAFDVAYLDALGQVAGRLVVVDDMARLTRYPVGLVVNQNAHADRAAYPSDAGPTYLLGLDHVMLRREFRVAEPVPALPARARRILIAFGGADPAGMTAHVLGAMARLGGTVADLAVTAVVGPANPAGEAISAAAAAAPFEVRMARDVERMADLMAATDLAVVSGGSSVWELARMGVPALVVETAPAEADLCRGLAAVGLFDRLGPVSSLDDASLAAAVAARIDDQAWRTDMSERGRRLVDGRGADRVVRAIRAMVVVDRPAGPRSPASATAARPSDGDE